jgi:hypothetical protein
MVFPESTENPLGIYGTWRLVLWNLQSQMLCGSQIREKGCTEAPFTALKDLCRNSLQIFWQFCLPIQTNEALLFGHEELKKKKLSPKLLLIECKYVKMAVFRFCLKNGIIVATEINAKIKLKGGPSFYPPFLFSNLLSASAIYVWHILPGAIPSSLVVLHPLRIPLVNDGLW